MNDEKYEEQVVSAKRITEVLILMQGLRGASLVALPRGSLCYLLGVTLEISFPRSWSDRAVEEKYDQIQRVVAKIAEEEDAVPVIFPPVGGKVYCGLQTAACTQLLATQKKGLELLLKEDPVIKNVLNNCFLGVVQR